MAVNKFGNEMDKRLVQRVADLESELKQLKIVQPIGIQSNSYVGSSGNWPNLTVNAGTTGETTLTISTGGAGPVVPLKEWYMSLGIRVDTDAVTHAWPYGASLTTGQRKLSMAYFPDLNERDNGSGLIYIAWTLAITNNDSVQHTYYCDYEYNYPNADLT